MQHRLLRQMVAATDGVFGLWYSPEFKLRRENPKSDHRLLHLARAVVTRRFLVDGIALEIIPTCSPW